MHCGILLRNGILCDSTHTLSPPTVGPHTWSRGSGIGRYYEGFVFRDRVLQNVRLLHACLLPRIFGRPWWLAFGTGCTLKTIAYERRAANTHIYYIATHRTCMQYRVHDSPQW